MILTTKVMQHTTNSGKDNATNISGGGCVRESRHPRLHFVFILSIFIGCVIYVNTLIVRTQRTTYQTSLETETDETNSMRALLKQIKTTRNAHITKHRKLFVQKMERKLFSDSSRWSLPTVPLRLDLWWTPMLTDVLQCHMVLDTLQWGVQIRNSTEWKSRPFPHLKDPIGESTLVFFHNVTQQLSKRLWVTVTRSFAEEEEDGMSLHTNRRTYLKRRRSLSLLSNAIAHKRNATNSSHVAFSSLTSDQRAIAYMTAEVQWMHAMLDVLLPHTISRGISIAYLTANGIPVDPSTGKVMKHMVPKHLKASSFVLQGVFHQQKQNGSNTPLVKWVHPFGDVKVETRRLVDRLWWHVDHPPLLAGNQSQHHREQNSTVKAGGAFGPVLDVPPPLHRRHYLDDPLYTDTKLSDVVQLIRGRSCYLRNAPNYTPPVFNLSRFPPLFVDPRYDCVVATAFYGTVEKTIKPVLNYDKATSRCAHVCFVGNKNVETTAGPDSGWIITSVPYHLSDERMPQDGSVHPFRASKWYKMNTPLLLPHTVRYFFWMDGDTQIVNASAASVFIDVLRTRSSIVTLQLPTVRSALDEVLRSEEKYGLYLRTAHILTAFYLTHLLDGFCEEGDSPDRPHPNYLRLGCAIQSGWNTACSRIKDTRFTSFQIFEETSCHSHRVPRAGHLHGQTIFEFIQGKCRAYYSGMKSEEDVGRTSNAVYTKIVGVDLHAKDTMSFLLYWYAITYYHWQDQVSLPIAMWRFGVRPTVMPFPDYWTKLLGHGK